MKILLDDEELLEIDANMISLFQHDIENPIEDIKRRIKWAIEHKCDQIYKRLEEEWLPKLREDPSIESIPKSKAQFCSLIFNHPQYKNRLEREKENLIE